MQDVSNTSRRTTVANIDVQTKSGSPYKHKAAKVPFLRNRSLKFGKLFCVTHRELGPGVKLIILECSLFT
jgi:hypothetical protein